MKEFLKGNDITIKWTLPTAVSPVNYENGKLYVYGGTCRFSIDVTLTGGVLYAVIGGELLPTGFYSLEYIYNYADGEKKVHRRIKKGHCFAVTEDETDNEFVLILGA